MKKILLTGAAGFIGFHLSKKLCEAGYDVSGIDCVTDYYDTQLKTDRLDILQAFKNFSFQNIDLASREDVARIFDDYQPDVVINLAAQAGVRYSLENPHAYIDSNLVGFTNVLEGCRYHKIEHLIFASSSSVYGANTKLPFATSDNVDHPISLYAATKKAGELMAHSYAHLYNIPVTGLRFFTVYGPWGRPDMAYFKFTDKILRGEPIEVYNNGDMKRDFTYIDDIVDSIEKLLDKPPQSNAKWSGDTPDPSSSKAPYKLYNIGNNNPEDLMEMIGILEEELGVEAVKKMLPMQPGDVYATYADCDDLSREIGFAPNTPLRTGIKNFVKWYRSYYIDNHEPREGEAA